MAACCAFKKVIGHVGMKLRQGFQEDWKYNFPIAKLKVLIMERSYDSL